MNSDIVGLLIQLVSGAAGGNIAGALLKKLNMGPVWNSILGVIGGILVGWVLPSLGIGNASSLDLTSILSSVLGSGVGGGALMAIVGLIRQAVKK